MILERIPFFEKIQVLCTQLIGVIIILGAIAFANWMSTVIPTFVMEFNISQNVETALFLLLVINGPFVFISFGSFIAGTAEKTIDESRVTNLRSCLFGTMIALILNVITFYLIN